MLGIVKRNFIYLTPDSFVVLYKAMICSHLENAISVWNPHHHSLIELDGGMWRYHANRMDARRSQFDFRRVEA